MKHEDVKLPDLDPETVLMPATHPARINVGGVYEAHLQNPSAGKIDQEERALVLTGFFIGFIAVALIFLPIRDMDRQATFAAGLSMLGGASTLITRTLSKSK